MKTRTEQLPLFGEVPRETLSKYLKFLRGPYSQQELAHELGVKVPSVENWEQGLSVPRPSQLRHLLQHYKQWAIHDELGDVSAHAAKTMGLKKDLTTDEEPAKSPAQYTDTES